MCVKVTSYSAWFGGGLHTKCMRTIAYLVCAPHFNRCLTIHACIQEASCVCSTVNVGVACSSLAKWTCKPFSFGAYCCELLYSFWPASYCDLQVI